MKNKETWRDRVEEFEAKKNRGSIRLRIPEDIDELISDWRELQSKNMHLSEEIGKCKMRIHDLLDRIGGMKHSIHELYKSYIP